MSEKPIIAILIRPQRRFEDVNDQFFQAVGDRFELRLLTSSEPSLSELKEMVCDADAMVTGWGTPKLSDDIILDAPRLRLVVHAQGGVRGLPYRAILDRQIPLVNSANAYARTMCEATIGMMLSLGYHFRVAHENYTFDQNPQFDHTELLGIGLDGKAVGIIGLGPIGALMAKMLAGFNVKLHAYDPYADPALADQLDVQLTGDLAALAESSDILTIHCGWTPETTELISEDILACMGPRKMLVCNARMPVLDEDAVFKMVKNHELYAALNLIPLRQDLWLDPTLCRMPNLLLTHAACNVSDTWYDQVSRHVADQLIRFFDGHPLCPLSLERIEIST